MVVIFGSGYIWFEILCFVSFVGFSINCISLGRRVLIFPKGNNVDHLSMYLDVADSATLPYGWSRFAHFSLAVVNQIHNKYSVRKGIFLAPCACRAVHSTYMFIGIHMSAFDYLYMYIYLYIYVGIWLVVMRIQLQFSVNGFWTICEWYDVRLLCTDCTSHLVFIWSCMSTHSNGECNDRLLLLLFLISTFYELLC